MRSICEQAEEVNKRNAAVRRIRQLHATMMASLSSFSFHNKLIFSQETLREGALHGHQVEQTEV
jgi:hypothetical protein